MPADSIQHRVKDLFDEAVERPGPERAAFLDAACAGDVNLRRQVERFLTALDEAPEFLESPPATDDPELPPGADGSDGESDLVGKSVGHYRLERMIATGGMGTVYEAVQEKPHRTVAIKVMRRGIASRSALRRFEHESQILARLRHPAIAQVYEAGTWSSEGDVPYFVMEYVPAARPITEYARQQALTTGQRLELFASVCKAVHHGHQRGIIHRDLKPANILIDASDEPKIIDFGVARATDWDMAVTTLHTDVGQLIGTLQYMSPEQCQADPDDLDTRSDLYALGVVLYELLCERLPYDVGHAPLPAEAIRVVEEEVPARPSSINRTLRGDVETILLKAMDKDRDRRYQSAAGLAGDITRYLNHEPIVARPPSATYQLRKFAQRHKGFVAGIGSIGAVLLIAMVVGGALIWQEQQHTKQALDLSETHFRMARDAVDELFTTVANIELAEVPHVEALRKELLEKAMVFYQGFLDERSDDRELRLETARASRRVGGILHLLGEHERAEQELRGSVGRCEELLAAAPTDESVVDELARSLSELGRLLGDRRRVVEAMQSHRRSRQLRRALVEQFPENVELKRRLASGSQELGVLLVKVMRWEEAEEVCEQTVLYFEDLLLTFPGEQSLQLDLARAVTTLGDLLWRTGRATQANAMYHQALVMRKSITGDVAASTEFRKGLAYNNASIGKLLAYTDAGPEAEAYLRLAVEQFEELGSDFPMTPEFRREASRCLIMIGTMSEMIGRQGEEATFCAVVQILQNLADEFPDDPGRLFDLLIALADFETYVANTDRRRDWAVDLSPECRDVVNRRLREYPDDGEYPFVITSTELNLDHVYDQPWRIAVADLDGDADLDLITSNHWDTVSILKNDGDGTFTAPETYRGFGIAISVAVQDLDGDGDIDLAVTNWRGNTVSIVLNDGDGAFTTRFTYAVGIAPGQVAVGDLDRDGDLDLAVANQYSNDVSILLGVGDGSFAPHIAYDAGDVPVAVAVGDLDGDGDLDLAMANEHSTDVSILLNHGDATFAADVTYDVGGPSGSVAVGDLDGDGDLDLAVVHSDSVSVLLNDGDGTFADRVTHGTGAWPTSTAIDDLDSDGDLDLVVANGLSSNVSILLNAGDSTFAHFTHDAGLRPLAVAVGDLDGDEDLDLAVANPRQITILLNDGSSPPRPTDRDATGDVETHELLTIER